MEARYDIRTKRKVLALFWLSRGMSNTGVSILLKRRYPQGRDSPDPMYNLVRSSNKESGGMIRDHKTDRYSPYYADQYIRTLMLDEDKNELVELRRDERDILNREKINLTAKDMHRKQYPQTATVHIGIRLARDISPRKRNKLPERASDDNLAPNELETLLSEDRFNLGTIASTLPEIGAIRYRSIAPRSSLPGRLPPMRLHPMSPPPMSPTYQPIGASRTKAPSKSRHSAPYPRTKSTNRSEPSGTSPLGPFQTQPPGELRQVTYATSSLPLSASAQSSRSRGEYTSDARSYSPYNTGSDSGQAQQYYDPRYVQPAELTSGHGASTRALGQSTRGYPRSSEYISESSRPSDPWTLGAMDPAMADAGTPISWERSPRETREQTEQRLRWDAREEGWRRQQSGRGGNGGSR